MSKFLVGPALIVRATAETESCGIDEMTNDDE